MNENRVKDWTYFIGVWGLSIAIVATVIWRTGQTHRIMLDNWNTELKHWTDILDDHSEIKQILQSLDESLKIKDES